MYTHKLINLLGKIKSLEKSVIVLFRDGYTGIEIVRNKGRLNELHKPVPGWDSISQSSLNRWINLAKKEDADLEIWHLLNRRQRRPGMYTNWQPSGVVIFGPHNEDYEALEVKQLPSNEIPTVNRAPSRFIPLGPKLRKRIKKTGYSINDADAVGIYVAELSDLGYSIRDIVKLWNWGRTRYPTKDEAPRVQWLIRQMRAIRDSPMSHTTIWRILQIYSMGPVAESFKQTQMAEIGETHE